MKFVLTVIISLTIFMVVANEANPRTVADDIYDKALVDNTKEAEKAYQAYLKALEEANTKVIKDLESGKLALNDTKKFTKLTITERAAAIADLDEKIDSVKLGIINDVLIAKKDGKAELPRRKIDQAKVIVGKWRITVGTVAIGMLDVQNNGIAIYFASGMNNSGSTKTLLNWRVEGNKVVFLNAVMRGNEFMAITLESNVRGNGTWSNNNFTADKIR